MLAALLRVGCLACFGRAGRVMWMLGVGLGLFLASVLVSLGDAGVSSGMILYCLDDAEAWGLDLF